MPVQFVFALFGSAGSDLMQVAIFYWCIEANTFEMNRNKRNPCGQGLKSPGYHEKK